MICVIGRDPYPLFTDFRFNLTEQSADQEEQGSPSEVGLVQHRSHAMGAMGNQIGVITDLEVAALASGFDEDIYVLVPELQKEIDGLSTTRAQTAQC